MTLPNVSGTFRCVKDPELRYTGGGQAVCSFTAVADQKRKDEASGQWVDDKVVFVKVVCFKQLAEHTAASVAKGTNVVVTGRMHVSEWETQDGQKRSTVELIADSVGVGLQWDTATVHKAERQGAPTQQPVQQDANPWGSSTTASDEPPF